MAAVVALLALPPPPLETAADGGSRLGRFSARFLTASRWVYSWSLWTYLRTCLPRVRARTEDTPAPSSSTALRLLSTPVEAKTFPGEARKEAKSGVMDQRTAPVVPVDSEERRSVGDWWMVSSSRPTVTVIAAVLGWWKPRSREGGLSVCRTKDSGLVLGLGGCVLYAYYTVWRARVRTFVRVRDLGAEAGEAGSEGSHGLCCSAGGGWVRNFV